MNNTSLNALGFILNGINIDTQKEHTKSSPILFNDIVKLILSNLTSINDIKIGSLVCREWHRILLDSSGLLSRALKIIDENAIGSRWPCIISQGLSNCKILPYSRMPRIDLKELIEGPCPFEPGKLMVETHVFTYLGLSFCKNSKIQDLSDNEEIRACFGFQKADGKRRASWIALYTKPIRIFAEGLHPKSITSEEIIKSVIAKRLGYRFPTHLELAASVCNHAYKQHHSIWFSEPEVKWEVKRVRCWDRTLQGKWIDAYSFKGDSIDCVTAISHEVYYSEPNVVSAFMMCKEYAPL